MRWVPLLLAAPLVAQQQPTFHAAWQDGLEAERAGRWAEATAAFRRALDLRAEPSARIVIYGNNLLLGYYPRTHLARCLIELGDLSGAESELQKAGREPQADREALTRRLHDLRPRTAPKPGPEQVEQLQAPPPTRPVPPPPAPPPSPSREPEPNPGPKGVSEPDRAVPELLSGESKPPRASQRPGDITPPPVTGKAATAAAPPGPAAEPARPLPWRPLGLGAGLALIAAWAWTRRTARRPRFDRSPDHEAPAFSPGGLPKAIGPYRIERILGRGGFADTFLARHQQTGQEVALKAPHLHRADDAEFRARFYQEAQLGARLSHPNLVRILDPGQESGRPYLAMEYLPGHTLADRLAQGEALALPEAVHIGLGVASAVAHAHAHGVVHRDLKPANIMLTGAGAKVMDLGIARVMDAETVTTTYAFLGTPLYAAPEAQLRTHVGPAADRYSLGVILYHMLAGRPPFQGETPFEILDRHRSATPQDLQTHRPDAPPALCRLVTRLLDKEPDQRPEDSEILRVLTEVAETLSAPPAEAPRD